MRVHRSNYFIILFLMLFFFGGIPVEFGTEGAFFHGFMIPKPVISIGLGQNLKDLTIRSSSGMNIYEVNSGYRLIAEDADEAKVRGGGEKISEKFLVLVSHAKERKEADLLAADLRRRVSGKVYVEEDRESEAGGIFEVRIGDFLTRGDALAKVKELAALGRKDVWIIREDITEPESKPIWMLLENDLQPLGRQSILYFIPANPQSFLSFNGRSYRGFFILKGTRKGIILVNVLNLEDYLKSVVAGELSPDQFNALEALKAQAVAARTYAVKNMGQFKELGYDLTNTPRSQLYSGMASERPLSTRAVEETRGEVLKYKGELINALYMSTCGGRTEDVENVFTGGPSPYLKSVDCTYERQPEFHLDIKTPILPITVGGRNASVDVAQLVSLGVIPLGVEPMDFRMDCPPEDASEWIQRTVRLLGLRNGGPPAGPEKVNFVTLARMIVQAFDWDEKVARLLLPAEVTFLMRGIPQVEARDRPALAYCLQAGIFPAGLTSGNPFRPVSRAELAMALTRILTLHKDFFLAGTFRSAAKNAIEVGQNFERKTLRLSNHLYLLRNIDGTGSFAAHLTLLGGERIRWIEREGQVAYFEVFFPPNSNVLDRSSRYNRWQVQKSRSALEALIGQSYPVGQLVDITVRKRGSSGRVSELLITGSDKRVVVRGFDVRSALGLRDTLFVIDRTYDESGRVGSFTFSGRGWGHGVGLCQVGAYGLAVAGGKYRDILAKYYRGVRLEKLY